MFSRSQLLVTALLWALPAGLALNPQARLTPQNLSGQPTSRLEQVQRCPDGTQLALGKIQKPWQVRAQAPLGGYLLLRQPGAKGFGLLAGIEGEPLRLRCTEQSGHPAALLLHRDDTGTSLTLVDVWTRAVKWEQVLAAPDRLVEDFVVQGERVLLVSRAAQPPGPLEVTQVQLATGETLSRTITPTHQEFTRLRLAATPTQVWLAGEWATSTRHVFVAPLEELTLRWGGVKLLVSGANDALQALAAQGAQVCLSGYTHGQLRLLDSVAQGLPPASEPRPADAFVACLKSNGESWLKQLGSPAQAEAFTALSLDDSGRVTVSGYTDANDWPSGAAGMSPPRRGLMAQFGPQGENTQLTVLTTDYPVTPVDLAADQSGTWLLVGQSAEAALALQVSAQFGLTGSLRFPAVQEHLVFSQP